MAQSHVLAGLVSKRGELVGRIEELQRALDDLTADVNTLDGSIKIFDPGTTI